MNLKISNVQPHEWTAAAHVAAQFEFDYPDRQLGRYHGVAYTASGRPSFYVYRTKTGVVVWGANQ